MRRTTELAACALLVASGCRSNAVPTPGAFEITMELPSKPGAAPVVPPPQVLSDFRIWVNQEVPMQRKNPSWRVAPAKEGLVLDMAPDGKWRCVLDAVKLFGKFSEHAKLDRWIVSRTLRCSGDGFSTSVEARVKATYESDGKPIFIEPRVPLYLTDVVGGVPRSTVVVLDPLLETPRQPEPQD